MGEPRGGADDINASPDDQVLLVKCSESKYDAADDDMECCRPHTWNAVALKGTANLNTSLGCREILSQSAMY